MRSYLISFASKIAKIQQRSMGLFSHTRVVLIDLSGTIHIDDAEIPGSIQALNRLKQRGCLKLKFVTNTTKESKQKLTDRLSKIGFTISPEDLFTSLTAARHLIDNEDLSPLLLIDDRAMEEFEGVSKDKKDSVLIGLAPDKFHYEKMNEAFRLLLDGARLIAIHKARYYKRKDDLALGPGPFVAALEYGTGSQVEVVGKPEASFFHSAISEYGEPPERCVMIGDDARDDICGAIKAGMKGILVQTGKYRPGDEDFLPEDGKVAACFSDAVDLILKDISEAHTS